MSLTDEIFNAVLESFESSEGATFQYLGTNYKAIVATENHEEDFDTGGKRHHWRVLIEATVGQFGDTLPAIRKKLIYNGRTYSIRDRVVDAHTIKITASTVST